MMRLKQITLGAAVCLLCCGTALGEGQGAATATSSWQDHVAAHAFDGRPETFWQGTGRQDVLQNEWDAPSRIGRIVTRFNPDHLIDAELAVLPAGETQWQTVGLVKALTGGNWVVDFPALPVVGVRTTVTHCAHRLTPETPGEWCCVYEQQWSSGAPAADRSNLPYCVVPGRRQPIVIDGAVTAAEWGQAARVANFTWESVLPRQASELWLTADAEALYLAGHLRSEEPEKIVAAPTTADSPPLAIWGGEVMEFFLARAEQPNAFRQWVVGPAGNHKMLTPSEAAVSSAATGTADGWMFELRVPWRAVGVEGPGTETLRFNAARDERTRSELSSWGPLFGGFLKPSLFGTIEYQEAAAPVQVGQLEQLSPERWRFAVGGAPEWTVRWDDFNAGTTVKSARLGDLGAEGLVFEQHSYPFTGQIGVFDGDRLLYRGAPIVLRRNPEELARLELRRLIDRLAPEDQARLTGAWAAVPVDDAARLAAATRLYLAHRDPAGVVGAVSALDKVLPRPHWRGEIADGIAVDTARREYENFQIFLAALEQPLAVRAVRLGALTDAAGRPFPGTVRFYRVGMVTAPERALPTALPGGVYPDPLLPFEPFDVPPESNATVWGEVFTPADCPVGTYTGEVEVELAGRSRVVLPCVIRVHQAVLPVAHALATPFVIDRDVLARTYQVAVDSPEHLAMVERYRQANVDHRLDWLYFPGGMQETLYPGCRWDGERLHWDWAEFDEKIAGYFAAGMHSFAVGFSWAHLPPIRDRDGREIPESRQPLEVVQRENPALAAAMTVAWQEYAAHLRDRGWFDRAYYYVADEPLPEHFDAVRQQAGALLETDAQWRTLLTTLRPDALGDTIQIWCPNLAFFDPEVAAAELARGKAVWWYVCVGSSRPNYYVDFPTLDPRMHFWLTYRYGLGGVLYWRVNAWPENKNLLQEAEQYGDGYLFYPGPDGPWPSLRSAMVRDGVEDYDLLTLLEQLEPEAEELQLEALCRSPLDYNSDPAALELRRLEILRRLDAIWGGEVAKEQ